MQMARDSQAKTLASGAILNTNQGQCLFPFSSEKKKNLIIRVRTFSISLHSLCLNVEESERAEEHRI